MHTVRNRHADKARAEAGRSKRNSGKPDARKPEKGRAPVGAPKFPVDLVVPPHRGAVITSAFLLQPPVATGRKAIRNAERRAAAQARVAAESKAPLAEALIILPAAPEPDVPEPDVPEPLAVTATIPAARALVPHRRGFVDVLAFALRDSGRRLARWSSARRRADDMKEKLVRAEARMRAMEAQLAALQELQERVRQAG